MRTTYERGQMTDFVTPENIILIYAKGGAGKSTKGAQAAAYHFKKWGLKTRVVGADGGGLKPYLPLIEKGIVEYWPIDLWDERTIFHTLDWSTKGWWPIDVKTPNSELLPSVKEWRECPKCKGDSGATGLTMVKECAACKAAFGAGQRLEKKFERINGFDKVGLEIFEGASAFGQLLLNRLRVVDPEGGRSLKDDGFTIAGLGKQHYGDAQTYLGKFISNSRRLPCRTVIWTALELRGQDDEAGGKPVYGPALPGKALTARCIPWFTDVLHLDTAPRKDSTGKPVRDKHGLEVIEHKMFLADHFPEDTKPYGFVAKSSGAMPPVLDDPFEKNGMETFFEEQEAAKARYEKLLIGG